MSKSKMLIKRNTTKYTFNMGYVLIGYVLLAITYGILVGIVDKENFVGVILTLLSTGTAFFGINLARVTSENVTTIKSAGDVAASSPYMPESTKISTDSSGVTVAQSADVQEIPAGDTK